MRKVMGVAAAVTLLVTAVGCGGTEKAEGQTFSVGIGEPQHLIPGNCQEGNGIAVISGLFEGLVSLKSDGTLENDVASSITTEDQRHWTIKLKPGRTFHNGEKVTASSFTDAWSAAAYGPNGWVNNYFFEKIEGYDALNPANGKPKTKTLSGLKVVDDRTFEVTLTAPFSQFPLTLAYSGFYPLPKVAFEDFKKFDQKPVGNGPFQMNGSWKHNKEVKLKAYKRYKGPNEPEADGVDFRVYSKPETAYNDLTSGALDVYDELPASALSRAKSELGDRYKTAASSAFHYLGFPVYDKRFQNPDLRHAISMAIDRKEIIDKIYDGAYKPADSLVSPVVPGHRKGACGKACQYDPAEAKRLFTKAGGWKGPMTLWLPSDEDYDAEVQAIANQLKENLGIQKIQLKRQPFAQYLDALQRHQADGPYRLEWGMDYPSPQNYLEPLYATGGSSNRIDYSNPKVDDLIAQGNKAPSIDAGIKYYNQAEDDVLKDLPVAPLYFGQIQYGYSDRVSNVKVDALVGIHLWDVKVED